MKSLKIFLVSSAPFFICLPFLSVDAFSYRSANVKLIRKSLQETNAKNSIQKNNENKPANFKHDSSVERSLPVVIVQLALSKNAVSVKEFLYKHDTLYNFRMISGNNRPPDAKRPTTEEPYYDKTGKVILVFKRATQGMFLRAQGWVPSNVKNTDVAEIAGGLWARVQDEFVQSDVGKK